VDALASAVIEAARRSDHETDARTREQLAAQANLDAAACLMRAPDAAPCRYGHALALGLDARVHPLQANALLTSMLAELISAQASDPDYDNAGPARVQALVLIRAPGWPLGPGDSEAGLGAAQRAIAQRPLYPPNLLALAEARAKNGDARGARDAYQRAREAAQALPPAPDRDDWLRQATQGLQPR